MSSKTSPAVALLAALLVGCSGSSPTPAPTPAAESTVPPPSVTVAPSPSATTPPAASSAATPSPSAATPAATSSVAPEPPGPSYVACGCGCCGGVTPLDACLYKAKGDSLDKVIAQDKIAAKSKSCPMAGCSPGRRYHYCD